MRTVYDGKAGAYPRLVDPDRSSILTPGAGVHKTSITGIIPQVPHTFALWESAYSLMNEKGLALGESTCSAHLVGTSVLDGGDAMFAIRQLMAVALERCETARCAVQTMGDLGAKYGFFGEDPGKGGAGESIQVADARGEAWVFHISGGVPAAKGSSPDKWQFQRGALWAAQRVPDDHVAVLANNFIIRNVDPEDTENFMTHPGLFELAQEAGLWEGKGNFDFLEIMTPDVRYFRYMPELPPMPRYVTIRQWWVFKHVAPALDLQMTDNPKAYPFSVPAERKLTNLEVMELFRTHYEGTEYDMTLGAMAGPFQSPNRVEGGPGVQAVPGQFARAPSIQRTSYTQVSQTGVGIEPVCWFAPDASASSVFVPFFGSALSPEGGGLYDVAAFGEGSQKELSFSNGRPPAWWAFDFVANWMNLCYKNMSQTYVYPKVQRLQREVADRAARAVSQAKTLGGAAYLAEAQTTLQRQVADEWWQLAAMLVVRYNDGFFNYGEKAPQKVNPIGYPSFWLEMAGFDSTSFYPTWFTKTIAVPQLLDAPERALAELSAKRLAAPAAVTAVAVSPTAAVLGAPAAVAAAALIFAAGLMAGMSLGYARGRQAAAAEVTRADYLKMGC